MCLRHAHDDLHKRAPDHRLPVARERAGFFCAVRRDLDQLRLDTRQHDVPSLLALRVVRQCLVKDKAKLGLR